MLLRKYLLKINCYKLNFKVRYLKSFKKIQFKILWHILYTYSAQKETVTG